MINYFKVVKPRIIIGNLISLIGGFFLASRGTVIWDLLLFSLTGTLFVIASACVFNNIIDIDLDKKMKRTKNRVLPKNLIPIQHVFIYGILLAILGFNIIYFYVNKLCFYLIAFAFFIYVFVYTLFTKRYSVYSTFIGSLSGAIPPVIGYCSVKNKIDLCSLLLYISLIFWQISHFYSISLYSLEDYRKSGIPILPIYKNIKITKIYIILFIFFYIIVNAILLYFSYVKIQYFIILGIFSFLWLFLAIYGLFKNVNLYLWSKKLFIFSLLTMCVNVLVMMIDNFYLL
ncbi:heme o synthase [Buchnera aphidicola]|uniref:Protoheme IX farnesyltransferase n=1 Tax=Buchnera aphidicola (Anoecia oenotherae) TaxID=1241833 RepID=A0A4D6Y4X7_9GAMM|nr:heme o synthase [Buchnera aphidicola]QCI19475.1 protoheme IX farnesyltransferase [Buchnera aphidicola (Anoecia oenotherae)]